MTEPTCRGRFALGTACGRCGKCEREMRAARTDDAMDYYEWANDSDIPERPLWPISGALGFIRRNWRYIVAGLATWFTSVFVFAVAVGYFTA